MEINIIKLIDELENKIHELRTELTKRYPMCPYAENHNLGRGEKCPFCGEERGD